MGLNELGYCLAEEEGSRNPVNWRRVENGMFTSKGKWGGTQTIFSDHTWLPL